MKFLRTWLPDNYLSKLTFFRAPEKRIFLFFLWGDPAQNRPQNPAPGSCLFSTRKSRSEVPERQDFGGENCMGKGGADKAKKGKKDAQKKVGKRTWGVCALKIPGKDPGLPKGWFSKGWFWRMFPRNENRNEGTFGFSRNENRNEGTFGCSPRTKTGTRVRSHVPRDENRNEGTFAKTTLLQNRPFVSR